MRKDRIEVKRFGGDKNALRHWKDIESPFSVARNTVLIVLARYTPLKLKNALLRLAGVDVGAHVSIGLDATFDVFRPDMISIGANTTIGYNATVLAHETTQDEFRVGRVDIGENVLIGANTTVLPGVVIGDGATVSANSLVNRDVEEGEFVGGVPVRNLSPEDGGT